MQSTTTFALLCCLAPASLAQTKAGVTGLPLQKGYSSHAAGSIAVVTSTGADQCVNASTTAQISGFGTFTVDNTAATSGSPLGSCGFMGRDVWFRWTAPATGSAILSTCGGVTGDSVIAVWVDVGPGGCPDTQIACLDDSCALQSSITFATTAGTNYMLEIGGHGGATFSGTFTLAAGPTPPANDDCVNASTAAQIAGYGSFPVDTTAATPGLPTGSCGPMGNDVWFRWTAPSTGTAVVSTCGGVTGDSIIAVWADAGPGLCPTTQIACLDDSCGLQESLTFGTIAGTDYVIEIGGFGFATFSGTFTLAPSPVLPVNDDCWAPIAISGPGVHPFDNRIATTGAHGQTESACVFASSIAIHKDSWWIYAPTAGGTVTIDTCGQVYGGSNTKIAVYEGTGCPTAAAIACNDDNPACTAQTLSSLVTFNAVCGRIYTIQLGSWSSGASLFGTFTVTEAGSTCGPPGVAYCFGDGTGIDCAAGGAGCANGSAGNGCANSVNAAGANLTASGSASMSIDTLALLGSGMPNSSALYFQGTAQIAVPFGDGLRCVGGTITRLGTKTNVAGASEYPVAGDLSVSVRGGVTAPGNRAYQVWYRNAAAFCTPSTFNLTNGMWIAWTP